MSRRTLDSNPRSRLHSFTLAFFRLLPLTMLQCQSPRNRSNNARDLASTAALSFHGSLSLSKAAAWSSLGGPGLSMSALRGASWSMIGRPDGSNLSGSCSLWERAGALCGSLPSAVIRLVASHFTFG
jgi:hypothetical protein